MVELFIFQVVCMTLRITTTQQLVFSMSYESIFLKEFLNLEWREGKWSLKEQSPVFFLSGCHNLQYKSFHTFHRFILVLIWPRKKQHKKIYKLRAASCKGQQEKITKQEKNNPRRNHILGIKWVFFLSYFIFLVQLFFLFEKDSQWIHIFAKPIQKNSNIYISFILTKRERLYSEMMLGNGCDDAVLLIIHIFMIYSFHSLTLHKCSSFSRLQLSFYNNTDGGSRVGIVSKCCMAIFQGS